MAALNSQRLLLVTVIAIFIGNIAFVHGQKDRVQCGECDQSSCTRPVGCLAGMVLDRCSCCHVCGRIEGEKCDNDTLPMIVHTNVYYGRCGDQLECRFRDDLKPTDPLEAICFCKQTEVLCGTDGKTYMNICQLTEQAYRLRNGLKAAKRGPCKSAPWIVSGPDDQTAVRGTNVAISCEGMGFPIPSIEWQMTRLDGATIDLPSDDQHIAVQARGGPERFEVTGWLQILNFQDEDDGMYHCVARNPEGDAKMTARITLVEKSENDGRDDELNYVETK